jgi:hypothetical protein
LNFSEPFLGGDEVNLQRSPSHPTIISTKITAVQILLAEGLPFMRLKMQLMATSSWCACSERSQNFRQETGGAHVFVV